MTPTPNPTAERVARELDALIDSLDDHVTIEEVGNALVHLRSKLRAGLLSEGAVCEHQNANYLRMMRERVEAVAKLSECAPSEESLSGTVFCLGSDVQAGEAWQAIVDAIPREVQSDWEAIDYLRTLVRWTLGSHAGVASHGATGVGGAPVLPTETPMSGSVASPSCHESKSGQDFATSPERVNETADSLHVPDPVKVAEVLLDLMRAGAMLFDNGTEEWIAESDPVECLPPLARALCEAHTEGKLT